jgi:hypothetical protein
MTPHDLDADNSLTDEQRNPRSTRASEVHRPAK